MWNVPIKSVQVTFRFLLFLSISAVSSTALTAVSDDTNSQNEVITVFAAASLADIIPTLVQAWQQHMPGHEVRISLGASAVMARQIQAGAPADLFVSANRKWVDHLVRNQAITSTPVVIAENLLVLAAPCRSNPDRYPTLSGDDIKDLLASNRFAMADPAVSPAGEYARSYLQAADIWHLVQAQATYAGNVRLALLLIERGGLPGFVYQSDAVKSDLACQVPVTEEPALPRARYFAVLPASGEESRTRSAAAFLDWLTSPQALAIWRIHGFLPPAPY